MKMKRRARFSFLVAFKHGRIGISRYLLHEYAVVVHQKHSRRHPLLPKPNPHQPKASRLFQLLLRAELVGVAALLLAAVGGTRGETSLSG